MHQKVVGFVIFHPLHLRHAGGHGHGRHPRAQREVRHPRGVVAGVELAGVGPRVAALTARAMNGEIDFEDAVRERVAFLAGLPAAALDRAGERIELELTLSVTAVEGPEIVVESGQPEVTVSIDGGEPGDQAASRRPYR